MKEILVVLNKDEHTVSYVDTREQRLIKTVPVDTNPHEAIVSKDGLITYITNSGGNTISVLDNINMEEVNRISHPDFKFPHGIGLNIEENTLWIASTYANKIFLIDLTSYKVRKIIPTHQELVHMIYFTPDKKQVVVPNIGSNNLTLLDAVSEEIITHLPVGKGPEGAAVHPDGKRLFVANQDDDTLYIIDLETYQLKTKRRLGRCPIRLVFSPDGQYAFIPNREGNCLSIVDCNKEMEIKRIPTGIWPGGVIFSADGSTAWVANNKTNDISIIDVASLKETGRIDAGIHPDGIALVQLD